MYHFRNNQYQFSNSINEEELLKIKTAKIRHKGGDLTTVAYYDNEQFAVYLPNPRYVIGSNGTYYDRISERILPSTEKEDHDAKSIYMLNSMRMDDGSMRQVYVQRVMAEAFIPGFDPQTMVVKFKDKDSTNIHLSNLYTVNKGDTIGYSRFTDAEIHNICSMMNQGMSNKQIAIQLGLEFDKSIMDTFSKLRHKRIYPEIVSQYPNISHSNKRPLTEEQADMIYRLAVAGNSAREIANQMGIEFTNSFMVTVSKIKKGLVFPSVYQKYNQQ